MRNTWFRLMAMMGYFRAAKGRHGVHSPQVFQWLEAIRTYHPAQPIPSFRKIAKSMNWDRRAIYLQDFGTGSDRSINLRKWGQKATSPMAKRKFIQALLHALDVQHVLEMGTALGVTTAQLAQTHPKMQVTTVEGDPQLAECAAEYWRQAGVSPRIDALTGPFDRVIPQCDLKGVDLIYIDGDHRGEALEHWVRWFREHAPEASILVDDIRWSADMWRAWEAIHAEDHWPLTIDFGNLGLLAPSSERVKQHFILRKSTS